MKLRVLPLFLALTTLVPAAVQAQRVPSPGDVPQNLKVQTTFGGMITAKNLDKITAAYGQIKCSQLQVVLQESNPSDVIVNLPGQPQKSKFPDSYAPVTVQATGNHLGLGCKFALPIPTSSVTKKGYLYVVTPKQLLHASPTGWQNPVPFPSAGFLADKGRNFVVELIEIK